MNKMFPKKVRKIMKRLLRHGYEAYVIGGAIRDSFMFEKPHDYDIFTNATGEQILKLFPKGVVLGGEERQEKILTVIVKGIEVSQYRSSGDRTVVGNTLEGHLKTCDFTINALYANVNGQVGDKHNGIRDLQEKRLVCVGKAKDRINEDKLRILRAIRFAIRYNMTLNLDLHDEVIEADLSSLPVERIREELLKIMKYKGSMSFMLSYGILQKIIPEVKTLFIPGGEHHNETVINHVSYAFDNACNITDNPILKFAIFMHDIGKGDVAELKDGKTTFYNHENVGVEIVDKIMTRLKFSTNEKQFVKFLVKSHMYSFKSEPGKKSYIKFFSKMESCNVTIEDYVMLIYCDHQGNLSKPRIKFGDFISGNNIHKKYYELKHGKEPFRISDLEINGNDVINEGVTPGPRVGKILNLLFEYVMEGELENSRPSLMKKLKEVKHTK